MQSFRITISPSERIAGRFVGTVRRLLQKVLAEESTENGLTQSAVANKLGIDRSVVNREFRGHRDITLGRVAQLAWAMGRDAVIEFPKRGTRDGQNTPAPTPTPIDSKPENVQSAPIDPNKFAAAA